MPNVNLDVLELHPTVIDWMKRTDLWVPEFETQAVAVKGRRYPCLCLEDEVFLENALASKISAYLSLSEARGLLAALIRNGEVSVSPEKEVINLLELDLAQWLREGVLSPRPMLLGQPIQRLLKLPI